jgi:hypothetical protein
MKHSTRLAIRLLGVGLVGHLALFGSPALADPPPSGEGPSSGGVVGRPSAAALGQGTVFRTRVAIPVPASGIVFLSSGQVLQALESPIGSCRLRGRTPGREIPGGTALTVESVTSTMSPHEDRGVSSVTWRFRAGDPAESLFCDTVGNVGLTRGDVDSELRGGLAIEGGAPSPN